MTKDGWIKTERGWHKVYGAVFERTGAADFPSPRISSDTMPPIEHVDGKIYESKAAFRAVTKANGLIEVGNDSSRLNPAPGPKRPDKKAIAETVSRAMSRVLD